MSLASRALARPRVHDLAGTVATLLSTPDSSAPRQIGATQAGLATGPTGIGTSSLRPLARQRSHTSPLSALYCPPAVRDDRVLGDVVNDRLIEWAVEVGVYPGRLDDLRKANFGRLIMLGHPESDDPDRLLAAAKCALAEWSVDDHYFDGDAVEPQLIGQRLAIAHAALDPVQLPVRYIPDYEEQVRHDPVLRALRSSLANLSRYASFTQVARLQRELSVMFVGYGQEAVWRGTGQSIPVWEYLMHRHENGFLPCIVLVDAVAGYELPAAEFTDPRVRRICTMAGSAAVFVNDLYSMAKEADTGGENFNLPAVIAAEEGCSLAEAIDRSVEIHNELMHTIEAEAAALSATGSPALRRFLAGVWAWLGGGREWHATSARYH
ncbi:family 2 encapsulin nanocompartment cargo protein terpene cyclase [Actinomycetes bacterium KLBMP 9797]